MPRKHATVCEFTEIRKNFIGMFAAVRLDIIESVTVYGKRRAFYFRSWNNKPVESFLNAVFACFNGGNLNRFVIRRVKSRCFEVINDDFILRVSVYERGVIIAEKIGCFVDELSDGNSHGGIIGNGGYHRRSNTLDAFACKP